MMRVIKILQLQQILNISKNVAMKKLGMKYPTEKAGGILYRGKQQFHGSV